MARSVALSIPQISGIDAKNEPNLCAFALCLLELHITLAGARPLRRLPGWLSIILAICIRLLVGTVGFQLKPTPLVTLKVALAKTQTMAIDITNAIQSWVRSL